MNQLGNQIEVALSKDSNWIYRNKCQLLPGKQFYKISTFDFEIEQNTEEDTTPPIYTQTCEVIVTISEAVRLLINNQNLIIKLTTLRGNEIIWGTKEYPVYCTATPNLDNVSLKLSCKTTTPLPY